MPVNPMLIRVFCLVKVYTAQYLRPHVMQQFYKMKQQLTIIVSLTLIFLGCSTSFHFTAEMKQTCDSLKYIPKNILELSDIYPDTNTRGEPQTLILNIDSTFLEITRGCIGPPFESLKSGKCYLSEDTLKFKIVNFGATSSITANTDTNRIKYIDFYERKIFYLVRKYNKKIYLLRPYQLDGFCENVIEHKNMNGYFHKVVNY